MNRIKHEFFMHRHETARKDGQLMPRYPHKLMLPSSSREDPDSKSAAEGLRPARRSNFGPARQSRVSARSGNMNPREERVWISLDIRDSRGHSSWGIKEAFIGERLLRLEQLSNFGPGRRSGIFWRSGNTNQRGEKFCWYQCCKAEYHIEISAEKNSGSFSSEFCTIFESEPALKWRLQLACQVACEFFYFTHVPQTDSKHFNPESSLGRPWLPGKLSLGGLDCLPEPESHGCGQYVIFVEYEKYPVKHITLIHTIFRETIHYRIWQNVSRNIIVYRCHKYNTKCLTKIFCKLLYIKYIIFYILFSKIYITFFINNRYFRYSTCFP